MVEVKTVSLGAGSDEGEDFVKTAEDSSSKFGGVVKYGGVGCAGSGEETVLGRASDEADAVVWRLFEAKGINELVHVGVVFVEVRKRNRTMLTKS